MNIELWPIDRVRPYEKNPRKNDAAVDAVVASIRTFGMRQPLVVDAEGVLIVGHTRLKAAIKLGLSEVPVHVADELTPEQAKAYRIADNQSATIATWDSDLLPLELTGLKGMGFDLDLLGFGDALEQWLAPKPNPGESDPEDVPEAPAEPVTQPGDLWVLGEHRLLCGDSTAAAEVARLIDGEPARMAFTDPPWNVAIGQDSNPRHRQRRGLENDNLPPEDFAAMLRGFAGNMAAAVTGDVYVVLGASEWPTLDLSLRSAGYHWSATIIWAKDQFVLGRSKYHRRYEPIWYGWHRDGQSSFGDRRDLDDVWEIARPRRSEEHPTMKPVELVARAIENSSRPGDAVYEPFSGSGSTILAAEQQGRRCRAMELEPRFVDVAVARWESFSGKKAERHAA